MSQTMQQPGEICDGCRERRSQKDLPLIILKTADGFTMNHKMMVPLCSVCDGGALTITQLHNHDMPEPPDLA